MTPRVELPSLPLIVQQIVEERRAMDAHAEALDTKAGVVLGFSGVLVGLAAATESRISTGYVFQFGLAFAVMAALFAAWAFLPRRYPVLQVYRLRARYLTAPREQTQLHLLDTHIKMIKEAASLVARKGRRVRAAVGCLAASATFVVAGILLASGGSHG